MPSSSARLPVGKAHVGNHTALTDLTVKAEDGDGRQYWFALRRTSIRRAGPLTAIVLLEGDLVARDGTPWIESTLSLQFHAGLGAVRVELSCTNTRAARHPKGIWDLGDAGSKLLMRDLSVTKRSGASGCRIDYGVA